MAKIIKITGYLIAHDDVDEQEVALAAKEILGGKFDCVKKPFTAESKDIGKWYDEHPLNYTDCPISECEKYFNNKT